MFEKREFLVNDKKYEIRIVLIDATETTDKRYEVRVFLNGKSANGYTYGIDVTTNKSFKDSQGESGLEHIIALAIADVKEGRWEQYTEAVKKQA